MELRFLTYDETICYYEPSAAKV